MPSSFYRGVGTFGPKIEKFERSQTEKWDISLAFPFGGQKRRVGGGEYKIYGRRPCYEQEEVLSAVKRFPLLLKKRKFLVTTVSGKDDEFLRPRRETEEECVLLNVWNCWALF
ncbi:hypothetical protein TNCT_80561 [Trichonephila clavata]|uniref:Uncharacterized protein n=1 Tax=Trichonephila clavata TaxID=2740835 RepID=A0A8X6M0N3_TRICU|nr:hypothetical protein TNCT_80561 [Trichonephila clavata]